MIRGPDAKATPGVYFGLHFTQAEPMKARDEIVEVATTAESPR